MAIPGDDYANYAGNLNGILKLRYAEGKIQRMYPEDTPLVAMLGPITEARMLGSQFVFPMKFNGSNGHTYAAAGAGAYALRQARQAKVQTAMVDSCNHVHRGSIDYETIARTEGSKVPKAAFESAADSMIEDMRTGMMTRVEESFWYAGTNLGICQTAVNTSNKLVVKLTYATFAPLLWLAKEGAAYDFYLLGSDALRPSATLYNNNATQSLADGTTTNAPMVLESVNMASRTLTFTGALADVNAVVTAVGNVSNKVGILYWGQKGNDTRGVDDCITNTGSLYGISATSFSLWQGNTSSNGDLPLTLKRIYGHLDGAVNKGLSTSGMNGKSGVDVWAHPAAIRDLIAQETVLKRHMEAGAQARNGFGGLVYDSEVGPMTFYSYGRIKQGEAFIMPTKKVLEKIGAREPGFQNFNTASTSPEDAMFLKQIEGVAAAESIMYGNLAVVCRKPAWCTKVTGIQSENYTA